MGFERIILRGGVELQRESGRWRYSTSEAVIDSPEALTQLLANRPIVAALVPGQGAPWCLGDPRTGANLSARMSNFLHRRFDPAALFHVRNIEYHALACVYHCLRLAIVYRDACESVKRFESIPEIGARDRTLLGGQEDGYFEFDACVTAARRMYEAIRSPLWAHFHHSRQSCPNKLSAVLSGADRLPSELRSRIQTSWDTFGESARSYRDCVVHYVPVEWGIGSAMLERCQGGAWAASLFIPDNPDKQSRSKFTFEKKIDALDYCHSLTSEIVDLASIVVSAIAPTRSGAPNDSVNEA